MKALASAMFVAATATFVVATLNDDGATWIGYVRAASEAAMVGAIADWFAVTALFRHPLGIPIPHTAIIPNRKDQIGRSLGEFVQGEFLTPALLNERLAAAKVSERLGHWLTESPNARRAGDLLGDALRGGLEVLDDADVQSALEHLVDRRVRSTPVAPLLGRALDITIDGGHHQRLLDTVFVAIRNFLDDNRSSLRTKLDGESPWWVPEPIDDRIFAKIFNGVHSFLGDVTDDPGHDVRAALDLRMRAFAERLKTDPELLAKGEELKDEVLAHPEIRAWIGTLWGEIERSLVTASADPNSELRRRLDASLQRFGRRLVNEPELQRKVDGWIERAVTHLADHYRGEVATLIASTVERWDGAATSDKLELQVGRDLQFIRINGTLVGGLAGLMIHAASEVLL
jgi:uncharacterized membrane-anchored protein YjiN (DUF445 family)